MITVSKTLRATCGIHREAEAWSISIQQISGPVDDGSTFKSGEPTLALQHLNILSPAFKLTSALSFQCSGASQNNVRRNVYPNLTPQTP